MSFVQRTLRLTFSGERVGTVSVEGLRTYTTIQEFTGKLGTAAQVRVWGLSESQMNTYSSKISAGVGVNQFDLAIEAGDVGGKLSKVMDGAIWRSFPDFQQSPESAFNVTVVGTIYAAAKPMAAQSQAGAQDAETLIQSICNVAGLTLVNNGAHAVLRNHATYGSAVDQIEDIARSAKFSRCFKGDTVYVWPQTGTRDETVIDVGPDTGMVGYPGWWKAGLIVTSLYNPEIQVKRQMRITSSIPKANGTWPIIRVDHELGTMFEKAPWFTTATLSAGGSLGV